MSTGKIIGYIAAGILIFFGVLFLWAAFGSETASPGGRLLVGGVLVVIGLGIIFVVRMREPKPEQLITIRQEIDIGRCQFCIGVIVAPHTDPRIKKLAARVVVVLKSVPNPRTGFHEDIDTGSVDSLGTLAFQRIVWVAQRTHVV